MSHVKICFFVGDISQGGGTERVASIIASQLSMQGYDITVLSLSGGNESFFPLSADIKQFRLYPKKISFKFHYMGVIRNLRSFIKRHKIDVLVAVESLLALYSIPAIVGTGKFHITWEHFNANVNLNLRLRDYARRLAARYSDVIITLTNRDVEIWKNKFGGRSRIVCIPNPALTVPVEMSADPAVSTKAIAVGRLTYQKGFDLLVEAWEIVHRQHPQWRLEIIGSGEDEQALRKQIQKLKLEEAVCIVPSTKQIHKYYAEAAFLCMSSRFEGLPMVLLEAQVAGLPVVSFDCDTGPAEVIKQGMNGLLVPPGDVNKLAENIQRLIGDRKLRASMGKAALENSGHYNLESVMKHWYNLLSV